MGIDLQTFILILGITHLMQVLVFAYQYKANKNISGPGWWLLWSAAEVIGFVLILLRAIPAFLPYSIVFQNIVILTGTIFIYIGVLRFFEKEVNWKFVFAFWGLFAVLQIIFIFVKNDITIRSFNFAVFVAIISFITARAIQKYKSRNITLTANFNTAIFLVHGGVFAYRALMISLGITVTDIFSPLFFNFLPYLDALVMSLLWTFGFIMMVNQQLKTEILETKEHFELIFTMSPDAAVISRLSDGRLIDCNEGFTRITGYSKEDIKLNSTLSLHLWKYPDDRGEVIKMLDEHGYCENVETVFQRKDKTEFTGLISANKIMLHGSPHILSVTRDITERKLVLEEIEHKNEELHQLNAEKDKFFSIIAHDLRSPFHGFIGLTTILAEDLPNLNTKDIHKIALTLKKSATSLFSLLDNLLNWSSMKQGLVSFVPQVMPLLPIARESTTLLMEPARIKGIELIFSIPEHIRIYADANAIQTVFRNLVSNAVKYTLKGGTVSITAKRNDKNEIEVAIADTGIGMKPEILSNLFQIDSKSNRKGTNGEPSTGLGLILCKELIEKNGGKIWAESTEAKGSVFYFTIPVPA